MLILMHILNFVHNNTKVEFLGNGDVYFLHRTIKKPFETTSSHNEKFVQYLQP